MPKPSPDTAAIPARFWLLLAQSLVVYALFLLPTVVWWCMGGPTDAEYSRHITGVWQAVFWQIPGLSALQTRIVLDAWVVLAVGLLGWWFYQGVQLLQQGPPQEEPTASSQAAFKRLLLWVGLASVLLIAVVPFHSSDLYGYLNRGFQQSVYATNPYLTPVAEIAGWRQEPLFHAHWGYNPCPYGFWFAQWANSLTQLAGHSFVRAFFLFKVFNGLALLGATALIYYLAVAFQRSRPLLTAYCFGANPVVLLHGVGNGHNDILLVFWLLLAFAFLAQPRGKWLAFPTLGLSILTKYASILCLPWMILYGLKQRERTWVIGGGLALVALVVGSAWPYVQPHAVWPWKAMLDNAGAPQHSVIAVLSSLVYYPLKWAHGPAKAWTQLFLGGIKPLFLLAFVVFYGGRLWQAWRQPVLTFGQCVAESAMAMTVLIVLTSAKFHPWYVVMFLPLLLLLPESSRWRRFGLLFSLFQLAGFTVLQNLPVFSVLLLTGLPFWLAFRPTGQSATR